LPKPRNRENKKLPERWREKHGAFYYRVPAGLEHLWEGKSEFRLGATLGEAHTKYGQMVGPNTSPLKNCGDALDWYLTIIPRTPPKTYNAKVAHVANLRKVFHSTPIVGFKPAWAYGYVSHRVHAKTGKPALTSGHRELETLSHMFTKLVQRGVIDEHPFKGEVRLDGDLALKSKNVRYIEDWEIVEALSIETRRKKGSVLMCQAYMRLKLVTGLAKSDMLRLRLDQHLKDDGIHVTRHKTAETTGKSTIYEYSTVPERKRYVDEAIAARPVLSPFLFCNKFGEGYIDEETGECDGFDSVWQRFMDRVLAETKVTKRFTEHDLRRKVGSDAESLEKARALLQHADLTTTRRFYRFKPERV
jgi:integrase